MMFESAWLDMILFLHTKIVSCVGAHMTRERICFEAVCFDVVLFLLTCVHVHVRQGEAFVGVCILVNQACFLLAYITLTCVHVHIQEKDISL